MRRDDLAPGLDFAWDNPYPTVRRPTFAQNVVSTSQGLAAQAGLQALMRGGNAMDAALTTAITLTMVEPISNGAGSDAFAVEESRAVGGPVLRRTGRRRHDQLRGCRHVAGL